MKGRPLAGWTRRASKRSGGVHRLRPNGHSGGGSSSREGPKGWRGELCTVAEPVPWAVGTASTTIVSYRSTAGRSSTGADGVQVGRVICGSCAVSEGSSWWKGHGRCPTTFPPVWPSIRPSTAWRIRSGFLKGAKECRANHRELLRGKRRMTGAILGGGLLREHRVGSDEGLNPPVIREQEEWGDVVRASLTSNWTTPKAPSGAFPQRGLAQGGGLPRVNRPQGGATPGRPRTPGGPS